MITDIPIHPRIRFTIELISHLRGIKSVFDTLIITAGLVFTFWLMVSVGIKYEVKIKGKEYGFTVGGISETEKRDLFINRFFWSTDKHRDFIMVYDDIDGIDPKIFEDFIRTAFPSVIACTTTIHNSGFGQFIYLDLENSQYPNRPSYNYIPFPELKQEYTVTKAS